jgi:hypothetical protein
MRSLTALHSNTIVSQRRPVPALVAFAAFLSYACGGCLSNEYVIPQAELARLAKLPPEQRGQNVQVVQAIGDRRSDAIDTTQPPPPAQDYGPDGPPPEGYVQSEAEPQVGVGVGIMIVPGPVFPPGRGGRGPGFAGGPAPGPRGVSGPRAPVTGGRAAPNTRPAKGAGRGGGGGGKDDLAAFLIVVALLATIGMAATEGARYDGTVAMYPWQPIQLKDASGQEREVPLAQITPADAAAASHAVVMDDEGWGMMRLGRRPLDRKGFAFKMDFGMMHSACTSCLSADGFGVDVQLGYFPHSMVGLLGTWAFSGGADSDSKSYYRNNLALELQAFPIALYRLHLGGFAHAGTQYADDSFGTRNGAAFGGGLLMEIDLTTRLALSLRADYTSAHVVPTGGWAGTEMFTVGVSIY